MDDVVSAAEWHGIDINMTSSAECKPRKWDMEMVCEEVHF